MKQLGILLLAGAIASCSPTLRNIQSVDPGPTSNNSGGNGEGEGSAPAPQPSLPLQGNLLLSGPTQMPTNNCGAYQAIIQNPTGTAPIQVDFTTNGGSVYSDSSCNQSTSQITLSPASPTGTFYFMSSSPGNLQIDGAAPSQSLTASIMVAITNGAATAVDLTAPSQVTAGSPFSVSLAFSNGTAPGLFNGTIRVEARVKNPVGNYFLLGQQAINGTQATISGLSINQAVLHEIRVIESNATGTPLSDGPDDIQVVAGPPATLDLVDSSFGSLSLNVNENRNVQVNLLDSQGNSTSGTVRLSSNHPSAALPGNTVCNGSCTLGPISFGSAFTGAYLRGEIVGNSSVNDQINGINVNGVSTGIRLGTTSNSLGEVTFVDALTSPYADNPNARFNWDFGDGNTAEGRVQFHRYTSAATYTITLQVQLAGQTIPPSTVFYTVTPHSSLPNRTDIYVAPGASGSGNSATSPTSWSNAVLNLVPTLQLQTNQNIRLFLRRGSTFQINLGSELNLNGTTGSFQILAYEDPSQSGLPRPILQYSGSTSGLVQYLITGTQNRFRVSDIQFTGTGSMDRITQTYNGDLVAFTDIGGSDHFYENSDFRNSNFGIVGSLQNSTQRTGQFNYQVSSRKAVLGCTFVDIAISALLDYGAYLLGLKNNSFVYTPYYANVELSEAQGVVVEGNTFLYSGAIIGTNTPGLAVTAYQDHNQGPVNRDFVIQGNSFQQSEIGIHFFSLSNLINSRNIYIKRNDFLTNPDSGVPNYAPMNNGIRLLGTQEVRIQNNVFSSIMDPTRSFTAEFIALLVLDVPGFTPDDLIVRHNSSSSNDLRFLKAGFTTQITNTSIYANNISATNADIADRNFALAVPSTSMTLTSGVFDFGPMTDTDIGTNNIQDGISVIQFTNYSEWYHVSNQAPMNHGTWSAFPISMGSGDQLTNPIYADPSVHDLRISGGPAVDGNPQQEIFVDRDGDDRDLLPDIGAFEAEGGGSGSGSGNPTSGPAVPAVSAFID